MKFELIELPYETNALEPVISQQTIEFHHGKHLKAYVDKVNDLIPGTRFENMDIVDIVKQADGTLFNNAGQLLNHNLYFTQFSPNGSKEPVGGLKSAIEAQWGSLDKFKEEFEKEGAALFGSGWVWLSRDNDGKLVISKEANGGNPVTKNLTPLLGFDVWEHAYYLDYQNRRADHLKKLWDIVDWDIVSGRY